MHRPHCSIVVVGDTGHGKSTLVAALATTTSAPQGRRARPTMSKRFTVLDVSGGRRSVSAAMRGTSLADVCVLVVSSTMGPQALTREHLGALAAGMSSFVIVINDFDGDADLLSACELEMRSLLAEHGPYGQAPARSWRAGIADVSTRELLEVLLVNAAAPFVFTRALLPVLKRNARAPRIVVHVGEAARRVVQPVVAAAHGRPPLVCFTKTGGPRPRPQLSVPTAKPELRQQRIVVVWSPQWSWARVGHGVKSV